MSDPLRSSYKKVERAERKLRFVATLVNGYVEAAPYETRMKRTSDRTYVIARRIKEPPEEIAWEVVEAVGHLRSALDKMVVAWVEGNGRGTSGVGFPFGAIDRNTGQQIPFPDRRIEEGVKKKLTPDQWMLIESQRPYPGGNDALWAINEIANEDKHRKDLVTAAANIGTDFFTMRVAAPGYGYNDYLAIGPTDCNFILDDKERETVLLAMGTRSVNMEIEQRAAASVVFDNVEPVRGKDVLVTLGQQVRLVKDILGRGAGVLTKG